MENVRRHPAFMVKKAREVSLKPLEQKVKQLFTPEKESYKLEDSILQKTNYGTQKFGGRLYQRVRHSTIDRNKMKATEDYWKNKSLL